MKNRRALSTLVGAVFFIIAASSTVAYVSFSMNVIDDFSQAVVIKESIDESRNSESFIISGATITNNKFDFTVQNNGQLPLKLTKLWVENTTDTTWIPSKFALDQNIPSSGSVTGIGQNLNLAALSTQGYDVSLVTERGNTQTFSFNSVPDQDISINLHAAPENIANGFSTTLFMTVTNNLPNETTLLNIVPQLSSSGVAIPTCDSLSTPPSQPSLKNGESAIFTWTCTVSGSALDEVTFTASIVNGFPGNTASVTICVKDVLLALESGTSLESLGFSIPAVSTDILIIHQESAQTPNSEYQLSSGNADTTGFTVDFDTSLDSIEFITKNKTSTLTIPAGNWNSVLNYLSASLDTGVDAGILTSGMIFHFEESNSVHDNAVTGANCLGIDATLGTATFTPTYSATGGVYSSGGYTFSGGQYISVNLDSNCNDFSNDPNTTAGWFYVDDGGSDGDQTIIRSESTNGNEFYEVSFAKSGSTGSLEFTFDSNTQSKPVSCIISGVSTDTWHHFVAVREDANNCTLYLNGGASTDTGSDQSNPYNNHLVTNDIWMIGVDPDTDGSLTDYFEGKIDSIMHWDSDALTSGEVTALYNTKYGVGAHVVDFKIERTDSTGVQTPALITQSNYELKFLDPLQDITNYIHAYNITSSLPQTVLTNERLLFTIDFVSGLPFGLRIDDETLSNPTTSYVQLPIPDSSFPGYFQYDISDGNYIVKVSNTGTTGAFLTVGGVRGIFDDATSDVAYASVVQYINGTTSSFEMLASQDSVYMYPGSYINIEFYPPTTHPSSTSLGTAITSGDQYIFSLYLSGYDERGRTFFKTIDIGGAEVVD